MATSQNGWAASSTLPRRKLVVEGVEFVGGIVDNDDVATVLGYVAEQFHERVEPLHNPGCWGFYYRANRNDPTSLSNHSSGTAIDINAPKHPNGVATAQTFTRDQIAEVHRILAEVGGVVRWGGDYTRTVDAMHFEINAGAAAVARAAARLRPKRYTLRAPRRKVAHLVPPRKTDSIRGIRWAAKNGYDWIDVNCLLSRDGVAFAQHGAPYGLAAQGFLAKDDPAKVKHLDAKTLDGLRSKDGYQVPRISEIFRAASRNGIKLELEAKDDHRFTDRATWERIADQADSAWGNGWQRHVVVKVLTNLSGGPQYARAVCRAAHAAGFQTMVLPRGVARLKPMRGPNITFNRGGRV